MDEANESETREKFTILSTKNWNQVKLKAVMCGALGFAALVHFHTSLILLLYNLIRLFMTIFCIFSFYTWSNLIYTHRLCGRLNLNDKKVYILFLSCLLSEFFIQFVTYNSSRHNMVLTSNPIVENWKQVLVISSVCTLTSYYLNFRILKENVFLIVLFNLTRFYGSVQFSSVLPESISAYFTYICALAGILFAYYLNSTILTVSDNFGTLCNISIRISSKSLRNSKINSDNNNHNNNTFYSKEECMLKPCAKYRQKLSRRRTSLPTSIPFKPEKNYLENSLLNDIQRIVDEMLDNEDFSVNNLIHSIKTIKNLINHSNLLCKFVKPNSYKSQNQNSINHESLLNNANSSKVNIIKFTSNTSSASKYYKIYNDSNSILNENVNAELNNSYSADEDEENKRSLPAHFFRRMSTLPWSTTTSATGLPIEIPSSSRQRSFSLRHPIVYNHAGPYYNLKGKDVICKSELLNDDKLASSSTNPNESQATSSLPLYNDQLGLVKNRFYDEDEENTTGSSVNSNISCNQNNKTSDYESGESPTNSDYNSDTDKLQLKDTSNLISFHRAICNKKLEQIKEELYNNSRQSANSKNSNSDKLPWQTEDLKNLELLNYLHDWSFPIFQFYEKSNHNVISQMAYKIFDEVGLFKSFDIPVNAFIHYFSALERGYIDLPYHNKIHAADVLHACYYLTTQAVPGFVQINYNSEKYSKERIPLNPYQYSLKYSLANNEVYGCLGANFTPLELLALYCSAAMHDYEHPGRNNQFLVSIHSPLAVLYNDRSVLENHHASSSWLLLKSNPKYNFLTGLDAAEWKKFRFLILENILATDLSKHFSIITEFNAKANVNPNRTGILQKPYILYEFDSGINWRNESDRLLCSQMVLKLADINAPLKEKELHVQWTNRIVQEFYQQGDEELSLGLPISPFMDRKRPQVAKLQENFINNLVGSLCNAFTHAGLLPGILIEDSEDESSEADADNSSFGTIEENSNYKNQKPRIFYSELLSNFKSNYEMWCERMIQEQALLTN